MNHPAACLRKYQCNDSGTNDVPTLISLMTVQNLVTPSCEMQRTKNHKLHQTGSLSAPHQSKLGHSKQLAFRTVDTEANNNPIRANITLHR
jgi:hypothetical protein